MSDRHDEDKLEQLYWEFKEASDKTGEERLRFKGFMQAYANDFAAKPAGEPVAYIKNLPEGTTHIGEFSAKVSPMGRINTSTFAFKYVGGELMVYQTDTDNEYPCWRKAKEVFFNTDFELFSVYHPTPEAVRKLVEAAELVVNTFDALPQMSPARPERLNINAIRAALAEVQAEQAKGE